MAKPTIKQILEKYKPRLKTWEGVVDVGLAKDKGQLVINIVISDYTIKKVLPRRLEGFRVIVSRVDEVKELTDEEIEDFIANYKGG